MKVKAFVLGITVSLIAAVGLSTAPAASAAPARIPAPVVKELVKGFGAKIFGGVVDRYRHARPTVNECGLFGKIDGYLPLPDIFFLIDQGCHVETAGETPAEIRAWEKQAAIDKLKHHGR